jgi:hypothetical protein
MLKWSVNPVTNSNLVYRHPYTWQYIIINIINCTAEYLCKWINFGRIVMPQSSLVRVAFPKLQSGISPPENSAYDRVCIDRYVLRKGRVCRMVTVLHFGNVSLRGLGHGGSSTRGTKHYIYLHIATFTNCTLYTCWSNWMNTTTVFGLHSMNILVNSCPMAVPSLL